ncbi:hypothetical protein D3H65_02430 [Paraflavitalea soli]|uniref:DUF3857 domain-containing protein n=1 Tax=Paraflavitalea soli TaxID=2315862 RepID=A0A3B7MEZ9_9BACT|nr:hypothetical protein [Paraflavitalea soli]AXY72892.1 hypothetical protein D3H65_02430 [Paraflavitalea soli]
MKRIITCCVLAMIAYGAAYSQQRISKKQVEQFQKNLEKTPLLSEEDADFKGSNNATRWAGESAVILCQKTSFNFDKKGISAGKRIGRNIYGLLLAPLTFGSSIYWANASNETKILIEETERRKILLNDKFAIDQYSVLYFRLSTEGDAFAARVVKKNGTIEPVDIAEAISVEDIKQVPGVFRSYTDERFSSSYRPAYFKIAVPGLEEGDAIEYEFKNFNNQQYAFNPDYREFDPVYYLCNRELPVAKQVIEVVTEDDKYFIGYKSLKGAPEFVQSTNKDNKVFRWEDNNREKMTDTRYVNEFMELPSIKFQVVYARNKSKNLVWFKDEAEMKKGMTTEELGEKAKTFWLNPEKLRSTGNYAVGSSDPAYTANEIFKKLKKKGIKDASPDEYVQKAYYMIRAQTMVGNWSDFAFAKVFSRLLELNKIEHEIVVSASNNRSSLNTVAFTQEIAWLIKYKGKYYSNPGEHGNPQELQAWLVGNNAVRFPYNNVQTKAVSEMLPLTDTLDNAVLTLVTAQLDEAKVNMSVDKTVEAKGLVKDDVIDEALALTPYMENDFRNVDGLGMWEGLNASQEEKATETFNKQKKEWKEQKPIMMKELAENEYGYHVEKYDNFRLLQDGRSNKKRNLKYGEAFLLADMTAAAGNDLVVAVPGLMGLQPKIRKEERTRLMPIDVRYPRALNWKIMFTIPAGYEVQGLDKLQKKVENACGSFTSTAFVEGNVLHVYAKKIYAGRRFDIAQWAQILEILDAAYEVSQAKVILKKK